MPYRTLNLHVAVQLVRPLVLVLEPRTAAWDAVYTIAEGLVQGLLGRLAGVAFLGRGERYSLVIPRDFRDRAPQWLDANRDRAGLLAPVMEALERLGFTGRIIVISTRLPADLHDLEGTPAFDRLLLVQAGAEPLTAGCHCIDGRGTAGADRIERALDDSVLTVRLRGPGFAPLAWDLRSQGRVQVDFQSGDFLLTVTPRERSVDLHCDALGEDGDPPWVEVLRPAGVERLVTVLEKNPWLSLPHWAPIPAGLGEVLAAARAGHPFQCPQCGETHAPTRLVCGSGRPALRGLPLDTCVLFRGEQHLPLAGAHAHALAGGRRLVTRQGDLYDLQDGRWQARGPVAPFAEVEHGVHALYHRL